MTKPLSKSLSIETKRTGAPAHHKSELPIWQKRPFTGKKNRLVENKLA
jgi:hypothetical protein